MLLIQVNYKSTDPDVDNAQELTSWVQRNTPGGASSGDISL